jgi:hypothetical protein
VEEFDRRFDDGEDISEYVAWSKGTRPNLERASTTIELTQGVLFRLDARAKELGLSRDALLEAWIREKLDHPSAAAASKRLARCCCAGYHSAHDHDRRDHVRPFDRPLQCSRGDGFRASLAS